MQLHLLHWTLRCSIPLPGYLTDLRLVLTHMLPTSYLKAFGMLNYPILCKKYMQGDVYFLIFNAKTLRSTRQLIGSSAIF